MQRESESFARHAEAGWRERLIDRLESQGTYPRWVLLVALGGTFAASFPVTILTIALGPIADEFSARETTVAWVLSAPLLLSAVALPMLGKMGDLHGHRKVFLLGFGAATLAAICTALAWNVASLIALRTLAAVVGGATMPTAMALILSVHPPEDRVRVMGWWSMTGAAAPAFGLVAGGPLVDLLGWRAVFVAQALLSLLALLPAYALLKETPKKKARFDVPGTIALGVGVSGLMFALGRVREASLQDPTVWGAVVVGLLGLLAFVAVERRVSAPLLPLHFFSLPNFSASIASNAFNAAAYMGAFAVAPLLFLGVFGFSVTVTSSFLLIRTISLTVGSPIGGRLGVRFGERYAALAGSGVMTLGLLCISLGAIWVSAPTMAAGLILQGLGHGFAQPPLTSAALGAVPEADLGIAAATNRLTGQVGVAFGITALTMVYGGQNEPLAFARAFSFGAALAAISFVLALPMRGLARTKDSAPGGA